jgi:general secretion pathway protein D
VGLRLLILVVVFLTGPALADEASKLARQARQAERRGDDLEAFALYTRAAGARPHDNRYRLLAERFRARAAQSMAALGRLEQALALDPQNSYLEARLNPRPEPPASSIESRREEEQAAEPIELAPQQGRRSFDLRGDARALFEQVMRAYGLEAVFDADFTAGSAVRFRLDQVEFREAIRALMALTGTFVVPVHERVGLMAKDTTQKRAELEPMMTTVVPIPQVMSVEEANEIGRGVQQALEIKRLAVDAARRQVVIRDTVTRVRLARALYEELSRRRGEVHIEIELLSVSRSALANLGLTLPTSFPVLAPGSSDAGSLPLLRIGGGETLFGVHLGAANVQADWSRSEAQQLTRFWLRATDGMAASLHIGDKFPIINALFSPVAITDQIRDLQNTGLYRQPFPSFTFEDLGLVLKVTPRVHDSREVSLTIEAEFRLLTGQSVNTVPVISSRKFNSAVRLRQGETSIVAGLLVARSTSEASGLAGLSQIPLLGRLLRDTRWQNDHSELVLAITPRLTSLPAAEQFPSRVFHWGSEARPVPSL